jgi:MFS family permease
VRHNFAIIIAYQMLMRTGWIFKTESIIMPAVLDTIGGAAWLRGCLPMLNRAGQSIPPLIFSRRLKVMSRKKWALVACSTGMSLFFLALASMWLAAGQQRQAWMPVLFLTLYACFFACSGMNQLSFATLQGKLVRTVWRGRLMLLANLGGSASAILCALLLLPRWLRADGGDFQWVFGFAGLCFAAAAFIGALLRESPDNFRESRRGVASHFRGAWHLLRQEKRFQKVAVVATLFGLSMVLFPHYQAIGRQRLGLALDNLMWWVVVQNLGTGVFSLLFGPLADWRGNRNVLRLVLCGTWLTPLLAIALAHASNLGQQWYWCVFIMLGLSPVALRSLNNYTLEICSAEDHPRYLSTLGICLAFPLLLSPLVGGVIDQLGFEPVFLAIATFVFSGWLLTWKLAEPRHERAS